MPISISEAFSRAIARTRLVCFQPFGVGRWFVLGFAAWLATLGQGGFNFNFNYRYSYKSRGSSGSGAFKADFGKSVHWAAAHLPLIIGLAILGLVFMLLMLWVQARGRFVLLDDVARHAQNNFIVQPWKQTGRLANQLFVFHLVVRLLGVLALAMCAGIGLLIAWPDIRAHAFRSRAGVALALALILYLGFILIFILIDVLTQALVVPLMYLRRCGPLAGWRTVLRDLLPGHKVSVLLFVLLKLLLGVAETIIFAIGMCMTCCLAFLPYLRGVVFLPIYVFNQALDICFVEEFGPEYKILSDVIKPTGFPVLPPRLDKPAE